MNDAPDIPGFYGRDEELAWLYGLFEDAKGFRAPNFAVVVADSGLGKTRLVQALYQKLAASPEWDPDDFWPDAFGDDGDNLRVNPEFDKSHEAKGPPRFLWLGMRWEYPEGRNPGDVTCPLPNVKDHLSRCLEVIVKQAGFWGEAKEGLSRLVPFGKGELEDMSWDGLGKLVGKVTGAVVPGGGAVPGGGTAIKGVVAIGQAAKGAHDQAGEMADKEKKAQDDAGDWLLKHLRGLMRKGEPVPTVLWLDDAQWVDPATVSFLRKLLSEARPEGQRRGWPLLVVATHWQREWNEAREAKRDPDKGLAVFEHRSLGGGRSVQVRVLEPSKEGPLGALLDERLPGLTEDQRALLLSKAHGNFYDLTLNIGHLESRKYYFEHRDPRGRLTDTGIKKIEEWESGREERVVKWFNELDEEYQEVLGWGAGSPLGVRLVEEVVAYVAEAEGRVGQPRECLAKCAYPLPVLDGKGAGNEPPPLREFRDRAWFRAANEFFNLALSEGGESEALDGAVREVLSAWVDACFDVDGELADGYGESPLGSKSMSPAERVDVLEAACEALPFDADGDWSDGSSATGLRAACLLVHECARAGLWDRCRRAGEALEGIVWGPVPGKVLSKGFRTRLGHDLYQARALEATHGLLLHIVEHGRTKAEKNGDPESRRDLAASLNNLGLVQGAVGDLDGAAESQREAVGIWRKLAEEVGDPGSRRGLATSLNNLGALQRAVGDLDGAAESWREALGILRALAEEVGDPGSRRGLATLLHNLGEFQRASGDLDGAAESCRESLEIWRALGVPEDSQAVARLKTALEELKRLREGG